MKMKCSVYTCDHYHPDFCPVEEKAELLVRADGTLMCSKFYERDEFSVPVKIAQRC